jgi:hypothetical protein
VSDKAFLSSDFALSPNGFFSERPDAERLSSERPKLFGLLFSDEKLDPVLSSELLELLLNDFLGSSDVNFFLVLLVLS